GDGGVPHGDEVRCVHAAGRAMPEHEHTDRTPHSIEGDFGLAVRGADAERLGYAVGASSRSGTRGVGSITGRESLRGGLAARPTLLTGCATRASLGLPASCF